MGTKSSITVKWRQFKLTANYHGGVENPLQAGNWDLHRMKVVNTKWFNQETFDVWVKPRVNSQRDVLRAFQRLMFHGAAGSLDPDMFCYALDLDAEIKATEIRYDNYREIARKLKNVFAKVVLNDMQMSGFALALIVRLKNEGIDCGLNLK